MEISEIIRGVGACSKLFKYSLTPLWLCAALKIDCLV